MASEVGGSNVGLTVVGESEGALVVITEGSAENVVGSKDVKDGTFEGTNAGSIAEGAEEGSAGLPAAAVGLTDAILVGAAVGASKGLMLGRSVVAFF